MSACITKQEITSLRDIVQSCKAVLYEWLIQNKDYVMRGTNTGVNTSYSVELYTTSSIDIPSDIDLEGIVRDLGFNVE